MTAHTLAPAQTCDLLPKAYSMFVLAVMEARSHELRVVESPAARQQYIESIDKLTKAYGDLLFARIEYASGHCHLSRHTAHHSRDTLYDLADDTTVELTKAFEEVT